MTREARVRRARGFVVGVVHEDKFLTRVVHREAVQNEADLAQRVTELAQCVERGAFARSARRTP